MANGKCNIENAYDLPQRGIEEGVEGVVDVARDQSCLGGLVNGVRAENWWADRS